MATPMQDHAARLLQALAQDADDISTPLLALITAIQTFAARQMTGKDPTPTMYQWALIVEQTREAHAALDERRARLAPMLEDARLTAAALSAAEGATPSPEPGVTVH